MPRSALSQFRSLLHRDPTQVGPAIGVEPQRLQPLDRAALLHYWHPDRAGVETPPADFAEKLAAIHPDLRLTKPPHRAPIDVRAWILWVRQPRVTHPLCPGWMLLMTWTLGKVPLPLDERLFAAIYHFDARHAGNAVEYFDKVMGERDRARAKERSRYDADLRDRAKDFFETTKIKNIGAGNKFALHHDGTILPSRGEANWAADRLQREMPTDVRREKGRRR